MNIRTIYSVEVRPEGSDKTLVRIDGLNEAEATKVHARITFPTRDAGYEKCILAVGEDGEEMLLRRSPMTGK